MKKLCLVLAMLISCGCAHTANDQAKGAVASAPSAPSARRELTAAAVAETIIKGKTTKEEIVAAFGRPNAVDKNDQLPPKEVLSKVKAPLPPVARTVEFWTYWNVPPEFKENAGARANTKGTVFRVMIFMDANGVAVDYLTESRVIDLNSFK